MSQAHLPTCVLRGPLASTWGNPFFRDCLGKGNTSVEGCRAGKLISLIPKHAGGTSCVQHSVIPTVLLGLALSPFLPREPSCSALTWFHILSARFSCWPEGLNLAAIPFQAP